MSAALISVDGSVGEGGGQILRTALALSLLTGQPFRIVRIRAGRRKPGLLRQHLTAILAAAEVGDAAVDGAEPGSAEIVFHPGRVRAGDYQFSVGTAGSTTLVAQTILPALMVAGEPSRLVLVGGTHNPFAPPFDFIEQTFLPQLARFGPAVKAVLDRPGFYPMGGGRLEIQIRPVEKLSPVELAERGLDRGRRLVAHLAALDPQIAERAFSRVISRLGWSRSQCEIVEHPADCGPGFVLVGHATFSNIAEVAAGFGERGVRAEQVADQMVDRLRNYLSLPAPVGEYLTDQLLLPLAWAGGGVFRAINLSRHARTNIEVIRQFLPVRFDVASLSEGGVEVRVAAA